VRDDLVLAERVEVDPVHRDPLADRRGHDGDGCARAPLPGSLVRDGVARGRVDGHADLL
jgi:hypothetical protein